MKKYLYLAAASLCAVASPALADNNVTVTSLVTPPVPATNQWGVLPGENSADATAELSTTNVSDTDGSLHIAGNRTRVQTGVQYDLDGPGGPFYPSNTGVAANSLVSLTADYIVNNGGTGGIQSPAFRVLVQDGLFRSELIWEAAYNGGYTVGMMDQVSATDLFWQYIGADNGGCGGFTGTTGCATGSYVMHTLAEWGNLYSSNAFVSGLSIGAGGGAGLTFDANVDNLVLKTDNPVNTNRYNFAAAVPEPATWGMMLIGFGAIGGAMRRQRRTPKLAQIA
jgi:hypothetical protein